MPLGLAQLACHLSAAEVLPTQPPGVACKQSYVQQTAAAGHAAIVLAVQQSRLGYLACTCTVRGAKTEVATTVMLDRQ